MTMSLADQTDLRSSPPSPAPRHRLTHAVQAHKSDIKAVCSTTLDDCEVVFSVSRDGTGAAHVRGDSASSWRRAVTLDAGPRFANSVCFIPASSGHPNSLAIGSLDGLIRCYSLPIDLTNTESAPTLEPSQIIQEHHDNVTSLTFRQGLLMSGSWDATARSFRRDVKGIWKLVHILKGHESAVWGVDIVDNAPGAECYLTASADLFIRFFEGQELKVMWAGHQDVVRAVKLLPRESKDADEEKLFISTSNDPTLLINSLSPSRRPPGNPTNGGEAVATLKGHTSIVYDVDVGIGTGTGIPPHELVTASEDGTARIWNWKGATLLETLWHPKSVGSVWCVTRTPKTGNVITGGSDGVLRIFSKNAEIPTESGDAHNDDVSATAGLLHPPLSTAEVEAFERDAEESANQSRRAEVLISSSGDGHPGGQPTTELLLETTTQPAKQTHPSSGIQYDALLPIDVSDDAEPLLLGVNAGDDPERVATQFMADHDLPQSYHAEIVGFIRMVGPK